MQLQIAPSILAADFLHLEKDIQLINDHADIAHLDVMDGTLVPNISFGFSVIAPVSKICTVPKDAHLMIINPQKYFKRFAELGIEMLSFHYEAARKARRSPAALLKEVRALGMRPGLAINPDIPVEEIFPYIKYADYILVMSVFAGFGGQKFIPETLERVRKVRAEINRLGVDCHIEVDGGVDQTNASALREAGADILIAGSSVFKTKDPAAAIKALKEA